MRPCIVAVETPAPSISAVVESASVLDAPLVRDVPAVVELPLAIDRVEPAAAVRRLPVGWIVKQAVLAACLVALCGTAGWLWMQEIGFDRVRIGGSAPAVAPVSGTAGTSVPSARSSETRPTKPETPQPVATDMTPTPAPTTGTVAPPLPTSTLSRSTSAVAAPSEGEPAVSNGDMGARAPEPARDTAAIVESSTPPPPVRPVSDIALQPTPLQPAALLPETVPPAAPASAPVPVASAAPEALPGRLPAAAAATPPPAAEAAAPAPVASERMVRNALARYEAAYNRLDAQAARAVWPSVDQRALARAFEDLSAQSVSLGQCSIQVAGDSAQAACHGHAQWTPKVGNAQSGARQWRFDLRSQAGEWTIVRATVR
jgi:hypothetical protein